MPTTWNLRDERVLTVDECARRSVTEVARSLPPVMTCRLVRHVSGRPQWCLRSQLLATAHDQRAWSQRGWHTASRGGASGDVAESSVYDSASRFPFNRARSASTDAGRNMSSAIAAISSA